MATENSPALLRAGCKVNISLHITGRREDGYHLLDSLFLPLDEPHDTLAVEPSPVDGLTFTCSDPSLASGNIVVKAYERFAEASGFRPAIVVRLDKGIPHGAGLGGGSSDAACLLTWLNGRAGSNALPDPELLGLAAGLGADVPFFLRNLPARVRGIGEILEPVANPLAGMFLVLVCPRVTVSTAWAFAAWDGRNADNLTGRALTKTVREDSSPIVRGIRVHNDLCAVVFEKHPELLDIVSRLRDLGAEASSMSGSGAGIFGLFADRRTAQGAVTELGRSGERVFCHAMERTGV